MKPGSADTKSIYWKTFSILVGKHFHLLLRKNVLSSISYLLYWLGICSSQNYICCGGHYDMVVVLLWVVVVLVILEVAMISVFTMLVVMVMILVVMKLEIFVVNMIFTIVAIFVVKMVVMVVMILVSTECTQRLR